MTRALFSRLEIKGFFNTLKGHMTYCNSKENK